MEKKFYLVLLLLLVVLPSAVFASNFSDLSSNHWAYKPIIEMTGKGILRGYPDGSFKPENKITRAEFSKILVLALDLTETKFVDFADIEKDSWAYHYVNVASDYLSAYSINDKLYFMPNEAAVREDIAVAIVVASGFKDTKYDLNILNQFSDENLISENFKKYVAIAVENGLMRGNADGTFNPKGLLTRAETSQLILNALDIKTKIALNDSQVTDLDDITFDKATSTIDLGKNWEEYGIGIKYNKSLNKYTAKYRPTKRVITLTNNFSNNFSIFDINDVLEDDSYITIGKMSDLKNYKKVKCSNVFEDIKYNAKNGIIDLGDDYSKYIYHVAYSSDSETYLMDTEPYYALHYESNQNVPQSRKLSVYTADLGSFARPDCYVPFMCIGLKENIYAVKVIDTRVDAEEYIFTSMDDIEKEMNNRQEKISLNYIFYENVLDFNAYIIEKDTNNRITENNGLTIESYGKLRMLKFDAIANKEYTVVLNNAILENEKAILKPISQNVTTILVEENLTEPTVPIEIYSKNKKVSSLDEIIIKINKSLLPEDSYIDIKVTDESIINFVVSESKHIKNLNSSINLSDIVGDEADEMVGKKFSVNVKATKKSFSKDALSEATRDFYWIDEKFPESSPNKNITLNISCDNVLSLGDSIYISESIPSNLKYWRNYTVGFSIDYGNTQIYSGSKSVGFKEEIPINKIVNNFKGISVEDKKLTITATCTYRVGDESITVTTKNKTFTITD